MAKLTKSKLDQVLSDLHNHHVNIESREIYLHGHYVEGDEELGVEYKMATTFSKNFHLLDSLDQNPILVHMHTIGGSWNDGMDIFHTIRLARSPTTILAHAQASSMSSIILQASNKRVMMPDADFVIHYGSGGGHDHVLAVIAEAEWERKAIKRMLKIYAERCINGPYFQSKYKSLTESKVVSFLEKKMKDQVNWWVDAEEAVYYGFADGIMGQPGYETFDKIQTGS